MKKLLLGLIFLLVCSAGAYAQCGASAHLIFNPVSQKFDCTANAGAGTGTVTTVGLATPSFFTVTGSPVTGAGTLTFASTTGLAAGQVLGTCGAGTTITLCTLTTTDIPTGTSGAKVPLLNGNNTFSGTSTFSSTVTLSTISGSTQCLQVNSSGVISGSGTGCASSGTGTVTSVAQTVPSWLAVTGSPITVSGTLAIASATGLASHEVIGTCGSATTVSLCALTAADVPANVAFQYNSSGTGLGTSSTLNIIPASGWSCSVSFPSSVATYTCGPDGTMATISGVAGGTYQAVTLTASPAGTWAGALSGLGSYSNPSEFPVQFSGASCNGGDTINIAGVGPVPLYFMSGNTATAVTAGQCRQNQTYSIRYTATGGPAGGAGFLFTPDGQYLGTQAANTIYGNFTGSTALPSFNTISSCSAANSALIWTSGTGIGCNTNEVVQNSTNAATSAMTLDMHLASTADSFRTAYIAGATAAATGSFNEDSTNKNYHFFANGADAIVAGWAVSALPTNNDCLKMVVNSSNDLIGDAGGACVVGTAYQTIDSNGSAQTQRSTVNFISGTNATVACVDNAGSSRTDCTISSSATAGTALSSITAAVGANSINNADNTQTWNWSKTTASSSAFIITENVASTSTGTPYLLNINTLAASTLNPLIVTAVGTSNGVFVNTSGVLAKIGSGSVKADTVASSAGAAPTADGTIAVNTTTHALVSGSNGTTIVQAAAATGTNTATTCSSQVVTAISAIAIPTCTTITPAFASGNTSGSGNFVLVTSPTLVTPVIGAATGTSLLLTGIIDGTVPVTKTSGTTATLGAGTYQSGYTLNQEGTAGTGVTYTLPATVVGAQYCAANSGTTGVVNTGVLTVYPAASSFVILNGVVNTVGGGGTHGVVSGGAAGDSACFVAIDSTHWQVFPGSGTWTEN